MKKNNILVHLGRGYEFAAQSVLTEDAIEEATRRVGERDLYITSIEYGFDDRPDFQTDQLCVSGCLREIVESRWGSVKSLTHINTLDDLREVYRECLDDGWAHISHVETEEEYQERKSEEKRLNLEQVASQFAREHSIKVSSLEFIEKVHEALSRVADEQEHWNSGEVRMEEWAAHSYAGCRDTYFDDLNYVNSQYSGRINQLHDVLEWLSQECPLLWAKWEERKLNNV